MLRYRFVVTQKCGGPLRRFVYIDASNLALATETCKKLHLRKNEKIASCTPMSNFNAV